MTYEQFFTEYYSDIYFNLWIFICILSLIFFILKNEIISLWDPLIYYVIIPLSNTFAIIIYLYSKNQINFESYLKLNLINLSFLLGYKLNKRKKEKKYSEEEYSLFIIYYYINNILNILVSGIFINKIGMLGLANPLLIFENNGLLMYCIYYFRISISILYVIKTKVYKRRNRFDKFPIVLLLIIGIISGAKFSVVVILSAIFMSINLIEKKKFKIRLIDILLVSILLIGIFYIKYNNILKGMEALFFRVISNGDIYYLGYPSNIIKKMEIPSITEYYIYPYLGPLNGRLLDLNNIKSIGQQLIQEVYTGNEGLGGPNSRYDVYLELKFNLYFGIILAFFIGKWMYFFRNIIIFKKSFMRILLHLYINIVILVFLTDSYLLSYYIIPFFLFTPLFYLLSILVFLLFKKRNIKIICLKEKL